MHLEVCERSRGEVPYGALLMLPLFGLPAGAYLVEHGIIDFGTCGMKLMFGIPCLSCGSTRMTLALLHGHPLDAVAFQPMMLTIYLLLFAWGGVSLWALATGRSVWLHLGRWESLAAKVLIVGLPLVNWAYLIWAGI